MDWHDGVAARLARLSLTGTGRPAVQLLAADAVRCGLFLDLALGYRLTTTADGVDVDPTPTGFAPADGLLAAITTEPERPLEGWFGERHLSLQQVIDALVVGGRLDERRTVLGRRRYVPRDPGDLARDKQLDAADAAGAWTPQDAGVAALGTVAHLIGRYRQLGYSVDQPDVHDALLQAAGPHEWLLRAGVDFLQVQRVRYRYGDTVLT